jgi:hypothetical protein
MKPVAALAASAALAAFGIASAQEAPISNGASLDLYLASQRGVGLDRAGWVNPFLPEASADAVVARDEPGISGDASLNRVLARLDRAALDAGGWVNPFVRESSYSAGNPLLAVGPGEGVTTSGPATRELPPLVAR